MGLNTTPSSLINSILTIAVDLSYISYDVKPNEAVEEKDLLLDELRELLLELKLDDELELLLELKLDDELELLLELKLDDELELLLELKLDDEVELLELELLL